MAISHGLASSNGHMKYYSCLLSLIKANWSLPLRLPALTLGQMLFKSEKYFSQK